MCYYILQDIFCFTAIQYTKEGTVMYYQVSKEFLEKLPTAYFGAVAVRGLDNTREIPELEQMLQENGFSKFKFYYPYPDYKFPAVIYSDEYLPKPGELRKNQRNFDADRITLFDEGKAFDGILKSGLFPVFSNSFLIEVEKKE